MTRRWGWWLMGRALVLSRAIARGCRISLARHRLSAGADSMRLWRGLTSRAGPFGLCVLAEPTATIVRPSRGIHQATCLWPGILWARGISAARTWPVLAKMIALSPRFRQMARFFGPGKRV